MRIVATADLHGTLPDIPECDVLIVAGDVCPSFDHSDVFQRSWLETNFSLWLLAQQEMNGGKVRGPIIGIGGNHDYAIQRSRDFARSLPWTYLLDEDFEFGGLVFHGFPWLPRPDSVWAFHTTDDTRARKLARAPTDVDVFISHGPPFKCCDYTIPRCGSEHAGDPALNVMLERVQPAVLVCGHIHSGYGHRWHPAGTRVFNVAHKDDDYKPINPPVGFELSRHGKLQGWDVTVPYRYQPGDVTQYV